MLSLPNYIYAGNLRMGPYGIEQEISPGHWIKWNGHYSHHGGIPQPTTARPIGGNMHFEGKAAGWAVGEVYGHRVFNIIDNNIWSPVQSSFLWNSGKNTSECIGCGFGWRQPNCSCGFYAFYEPQDDYEGNVRGIIKGYGMVDKGTRGFKAQHAEIVAITVPKGLVPEAAAVGSGNNINGSTLRTKYRAMTPTRARAWGVAAGFALSLAATALFTLITLGAAPPLIALMSVVTLTLTAMYCSLVRKISRASRRITGYSASELNRRNFNYKKFVNNFPDIEVFTDEREMFAAYADVVAENRSAKVEKGKPEYLH